jgi:short-subunit dehydrogenase
MKTAIVIGATSGIGREVALLLLQDGYRLGVAARREAQLLEFQALAPDRIETLPIDVTTEDAPERLRELVSKTGGMDLFFLASGIGTQNPELEEEAELRTVRTNALGWTQMVLAAFHYFAEHGGGHIAAISSIAGTRGLGASPAYSATKRYQNTYLEALSQLAHIRKLNIAFTDIRPGFVRTALLNDGHNYPLQMEAPFVAKKIVSAIRRKKRVVVIDWRYRILVFVWRLIPRFVWERMPVVSGKY